MSIASMPLMCTKCGERKTCLDKQLGLQCGIHVGQEGIIHILCPKCKKNPQTIPITDIRLCKGTPGYGPWTKAKSDAWFELECPNCGYHLVEPYDAKRHQWLEEKFFANMRFSSGRGL